MLYGGYKKRGRVVYFRNILTNTIRTSNASINVFRHIFQFKSLTRLVHGLNSKMFYFYVNRSLHVKQSAHLKGNIPSFFFLASMVRSSIVNKLLINYCFGCEGAKTKRAAIEIQCGTRRNSTVTTSVVVPRLTPSVMTITRIIRIESSQFFRSRCKVFDKFLFAILPKTIQT